ncbi:glycosyltransferase family 2 protein [Solirhodobacter olei]|uniref:glycosyltransferase family 2 protein n=1 Tax=Solirhodobacter olei TaxID=2493082 RepID=UPI000FDA02CF|nr:glycosyltransferase [Solirhodobacter olei]
MAQSPSNNYDGSATPQTGSAFAQSESLAAVLIGRNEGVRLIAAIAAARDQVRRVVYVDSGSTDGSVAAARAAGIDVVELERSRPFTAARARNAGAEALRRTGIYPEFIQFIDGDCELRPGWLGTASEFLKTHPRVAIACGRLRERYPGTSIYNRLCDREWDTPIGPIRECGGIMLVRSSSFDGVGGFNSSMIAAEDSELCVRLRSAGWEIWKLDAEMAWHDAAMTQFSQWWRRSRRSGYSSAEGVAMHGRPPENFRVAVVRRALTWGLLLPFATLVAAIFLSPWWLLLLLAYPAQIIRLTMSGGGSQNALENAVFLTLGKFPETQGIVEYVVRRLLVKPAAIIEYN